MFRCACPPNDCVGLVCDCRGGDAAARAELFSIHYELVSTIVRSRLGRRRREEWDDCVQEVQLRILTKLPSWQGRTPFCHWVSVVACRVAIDWVRRVRYREEPIMVDPPQRDPPISAEDVITCIEEAAKEFPPEIYGVYDMKRQGKTNEDVAKRLGVCISLIYIRLRRMRMLLKHCLER